MTTHVSTAVAVRPVRVDQQQFPGEMASATTNLSQGDLKLLSFRLRVAVEQQMDRGIRRQEGQSVEEFEAAERNVHSFPDPLQTQGRLMNQLHRQSRLDPHRRLTCPAAEQVPSPQAKMFRDQQPQACHVVTDLVGQSLSHAAFDAEWIAVDAPHHLAGDLGRDFFGHPARAAPVKFFFAARTR